MVKASVPAGMSSVSPSKVPSMYWRLTTISLAPDKAAALTTSGEDASISTNPTDSNAFVPRSAKSVENSMLCSLLQPAKALSSILVTPGAVNSQSSVQPAKAS